MTGTWNETAAGRRTQGNAARRLVLTRILSATPANFYCPMLRQEGVFTGGDGAILGFVRHQRRGGTALVYLHGISSHAGWFDGPADKRCARGYDVLCLARKPG